MIPQKGDRIIVKNIPKNYQFRGLYDLRTDGTGLGTIDDHFNIIKEKGIVPFYCGHVPYKEEDGRIEISGSGNSVNLSKVTFVKQALAPFWRFKDGSTIWSFLKEPIKIDLSTCRYAYSRISRESHNGKQYMEQVNWFECNFNALKKEAGK